LPQGLLLFRKLLSFQNDFQATSEFWRQKMRTVHAIMDLNKDGVVSFDDFKMLGDRFIELGHLTTEQQSEFRNTMKVPIADLNPTYLMLILVSP